MNLQIDEQQDTVTVRIGDGGKFEVVNASTTSTDTLATFDYVDNANRFADGYHIGEGIAIHLDDYHPSTLPVQLEENIRSTVDGLIKGLCTGGIIPIEVLEEAIARHK